MTVAVCLIQGTVIAVRIQVVSKDICFCVRGYAVRTDKPPDLRVVVSRVQVVETSFRVIIVAPVTERVLP